MVGHTLCYGHCSDRDSWRLTLVDRDTSRVQTIIMITFDLTMLSLTLMPENCLCQTFWDSFFKSSPKHKSVVVTNMATEEEKDVDVSLYDSNHLDFKSSYGLIQDVLGSDRKSRNLWNNWAGNDVLLDDGDLLVLKGGLLNPYTGPKKRKKTNNGWRRSFIVNNDNNFEPSQRISLTSLEEVRRSDRYDDSDSGDITGHDQDTNWTANDRASLQLQSDTQYLNLFGFNVQCFIC